MSSSLSAGSGGARLRACPARVATSFNLLGSCGICVWSPGSLPFPFPGLPLPLPRLILLNRLT
eukprot:12326672-Alexandrium_andersonii.AAC.1